MQMPSGETMASDRLQVDAPMCHAVIQRQVVDATL